MAVSDICPERHFVAPVEDESPSIEAIGYYDIMILGLTGQGKTTTANKLLIANPSGKHYKKMDPSAKTIVASTIEAQMEDLSMWLIPNDEYALERISVRLKNLVFFRILDNPHLEINAAHDSDMNIHRKTLKCELFSNETTKVRVLDVPGFFGSTATTQVNLSEELSPTSTSVMQEAHSTHIATMRSILHTQTIMKMRFKRILYFLPCRGALNIASATLQQELELLAYFFGRCIFDSIVLVATLDNVTYEISDNVHFPQAMLDSSRKIFIEILKGFFPNDTPNPPIIFISLKETCESILAKVKAAEVVQADLKLELSPSLCSRCGVTIGEKNRKRVAVVKRYGLFQQIAAGPGWKEAILYEHSHCHPVLVPRYSRGGKLTEGLSYVVRALVHLEWNWPDLNVEKCKNCKAPPGTEGCMMIGSKYKDKLVDHTNKVENCESRSFSPRSSNASSSSVQSQSDVEHLIDNIRRLSVPEVNVMGDDAVYKEKNQSSNSREHTQPIEKEGVQETEPQWR